MKNKPNYFDLMNEVEKELEANMELNQPDDYYTFHNQKDSEQLESNDDKFNKV